MNQQDLFLADETQYQPDHQLTLPVSVVEIGPQKKRSHGQHGSKSSRTEYSPFPREIADLCFQFFMRDTTLVFDPFAGWGERGLAAKRHGRNYVGFDISEASIASAQKLGVTNTLADSRTATIPTHNGLVTCPPYWNLEKYSAEGLDGAATWNGFLAEYREVLERCWAQADSGSVYCIMVGEWRKNHVFHDLEGQTRFIMQDLGAVIIDQVVVSRRTVSKIKIMLPQAKRLGYTVRVHESLLVFRKP